MRYLIVKLYDGNYSHALEINKNLEFRELLYDPQILIKDFFLLLEGNSSYSRRSRLENLLYIHILMFILLFYEVRFAFLCYGKYRAYFIAKRKGITRKMNKNMKNEMPLLMELEMFLQKTISRYLVAKRLGREIAKY